jgi:hypothetical protein
MRLGADSLSTEGRLHELWLVECFETRQSRTVEACGKGGKGGAFIIVSILANASRTTGITSPDEPRIAAKRAVFKKNFSYLSLFLPDGQGCVHPAAVVLRCPRCLRGVARMISPVLASPRGQ